MKTAFGLLMIIVSFVGTMFFRYYNGRIIPHPTIWYLSFLILGLLGGLLIYNATRNSDRADEQDLSLKIQKLKATSEKIFVNFDFCEFKNGAYSYQIDDPNISSVKFIAPSSMRSFADISITENVTQSYLIYNHSVNGQNKKYISQSFPLDPTTLSFYVLNNKLSLYIDRFGTNKYFFELENS